MKDFLVPFITILVLTCLAFYAGRKSTEKGRFETVTERVDTLVIRDTITAYRPVSVTRRVIDTVLVPVPEFIVEKDTVFAVLEREQVAWEDSLARVYASGIRPQVDSVIHFTKTKVITREVTIRKDSRWGIGIQGGVGVGKDGLTPYVGVGVQFNILSW